MNYHGMVLPIQGTKKSYLIVFKDISIKLFLKNAKWYVDSIQHTILGKGLCVVFTTVAQDVLIPTIQIFNK